MKTLLCILFISSAVALTSCKKSDNDPGSNPTPTTGVPSLNGTWKYDSNIGGGCPDLISTVFEIKNGTVAATSVPSNSSGWKAGDNFLTNMAQTTAPNNYTANGYSKSGGQVADPNIKVTLVTSSDIKSMTVTYTNVCNPVQLWTKSN